MAAPTPQTHQPLTMDLADVLLECGRFQAGFATLIMASADGKGHPEASYAPYAQDGDGVFYVYLSELSPHTRNLLATPRVSVLFIQDEREAANLYARRRLTLQCTVRTVDRGTALWGRILDSLAHRFGEIVPVLRDLKDFHLFRLEPVSGTYVRGFAQAFDLSGPDLKQIRHATGESRRVNGGDGPDAGSSVKS